VQAEWEPDELIDAWTLTGDDRDLVGNKAGATRLGFAVMLKFYEIDGRFPAYPEEVPPAAVRYLGSLVKVAPALFAKYSWTSRSIKYHRSQIRRVYGTRPPTEDDEERWAQWLADELCPTETNRDRLAAALRRRCRSEKVEPPSTGQVERVVASGSRRFDDAFAATTAARLGPATCDRLEDLLSRPNVLAGLKSDPGPLGLDTLLAEIGKLSTVRALGLDETVFAGASDRIVAAWRARAARMYPSDFTDCGDPVRYTLLAALCWTRQAELVDGLVELLIGLIHRINARAERRVEKELIGELANVPGKRGIFTKMVDAALARGTSGGVRIITRKGSPWVSVPKLEKLPGPKNLGALKAQVERRWGTIDLLDILKDTAFITDFTDSFASFASREVLDSGTLNRRLLLVLFALGTNMGIRQMAITGEHGVGEAELRHVRATYVTRENLRAAITTVVNATLEVRDPQWWGEATSTASDSKRFACWDSNLMTEFHARYGGYGVMIYWHVERGRLCVYSQLKSCSSSEAAAMIEGLLRHGTDAEIEAN
jgi:hypothetical protein